MKIKTSKSVITALISFIIALIVGVSAVYAWFANSTTKKISQFSLGVMDISSEEATGLTFNGSAGISVNIQMYPGDYYTLPFESQAGSKELYFDNLSIATPTAESLSSIYSSIYTISDYSYLADAQNNRWVGFDPYIGLSDIQKQEYYESFLQSITNAIEIAVVEWDAAQGASELNAEQLASLEYIPLTDETTIVTYNNNYSQTSSAVSVENDGTKCYTLVIRYNPNCFPTVTKDGKQVRMNNSNAYIGQRVTASLALRNA